MVLTQLKQGTPFIATAKIFGIAGNKFRRIVEGFVSKLAKDFIDNYIATDSMAEYWNKELKFAHFALVIEAIDVTFQRLYACGSNYKEKKYRFSGKHKAYGWKTEVAVDPNSSACYVSPPYPGSHHNMKIFKKHVNKHVERLTKVYEDYTKDDDMTIDLVDENKMWGAILDCGYEGARDYGRFITPKKKTACRDLDAGNRKRNGCIEEDCVLVENYFGRAKTLWGMADRTYRLRNAMYGFYMKFVFALTNYHVTLMPLRAEDGNVKRNYYQRLLDNHKRSTKKRQQQQQDSCKRTKAWLSVTNSTNGSGRDLSNLDSTSFMHASGNESGNNE